MSDAPHGTLERTRFVMQAFFDSMRETGHRPQHVREVLAEWGFVPGPETAAAIQDRFCDSHCTWRDHHPDCIRAEPPASSTDTPPHPL